MAFSKLTRIILYVIAGISLLVVLFYYIGPKTVDYDALEAKVDQAENPVDLTTGPVPPPAAADTAAADSTVADTVTAITMATEDSTTIEATLETGGSETTIDVSEGTQKDVREALTGWEYLVYNRIGIALFWAYILLLLTLLSSIIFPLIAVFSNTKALIRLVLVLAGAAVLVLISWALSSDTPINIIGYTGTDNSDPTTLRLIDTVLYVTYLLFGLALASILYAIISKAFK